MASLRSRDEQPSFLSRVVGALMSLVFAGLTVISIPWMLAWKFPIRLGLLLGLPAFIFAPIFWLWVLIVVLVALHIGFKAGVHDTMDIFNTLWKTGESHDKRVWAMSESLRTTIILSAIATFILLCFRFV